MVTAYIALENGDVLYARGCSPGTAHGEVVFTTAYTGYEESLTDPSYEAQILTFAYPLIGNYGVRSARFESNSIHPNAVIARELTDEVTRWLIDEEVPTIDCVDTRKIVRVIRDRGVMRCGIVAGKNATPDHAKTELDSCRKMSEHTEIGARVSVTDYTAYSGGGKVEIALIDCGVKRSIIKSLTSRGADIHVLPYNSRIDDIRRIEPDLLFFSNGPGDPAVFSAAQTLVQEFVGDVPIAGICLGQQIIARALGGTTEKMEFGHRGVNQPVQNCKSDKVVMTTQNHGYTVNDPGELTVTHRNLNDDTFEGLRSEEMRVLTRQYHPEGNPGPHDSLTFFDDVIQLGTDSK